MKVLIVYAHHEPRSFNGALKDTAVTTLGASGHEMIVSDLYAAGFEAAATRGDFLGTADPGYFKYQTEQRAAWANGRGDGFAPDITEEQRRLVWCDLVILQFPLWWFSVPAVLKGWIDRVLAVGFAYGGGRWFEAAPLAGRKALLSVTMGAKADRWGPDALVRRHRVDIASLARRHAELLRIRGVAAPRRTRARGNDGSRAQGRAHDMGGAPERTFRRGASFFSARIRLRRSKPSQPVSSCLSRVGRRRRCPARRR